MRVAILYIGIGKYIDFWKGFYVSCEEHFLKTASKEYFVFTDAEKIYKEENIHKLYQSDLGWPGNSLLRYSFFMQIINDLEQYDYIYFFNGNVLFLQDISEEEFCPADDSLLVVQHHYFVDKPNTVYPYDRNPESGACIPMGEGKHYVCGGLNGAKAPVFINFIKVMYQRIEMDNHNNVVALWHDESHVNRYVLDFPNITLMPPSYCYPELVANPDISLERKIVCRDKRKYFNLYKFKEPEQELNNLLADSQQLLEKDHYEKLELRWLYLKSKNIYLGEYFKLKGINNITIVISNRFGDLFYSELMNKDVNVLKVINENYEDLYNNGIKYNVEETKYATVITDTFNFAKILDIMILRGEKNIISLEDIINTLYEKYYVIENNSFISFRKLIWNDNSLGTEKAIDGEPICYLPQDCKVVLYGGGKIGAKYYSILKKSISVNLVLWVDSEYRKKQEEGLPIHNIEVIKDTLYDYIILGTSKEEIMESMRKMLETKEIDLKKVIWYNKKIQSWESVKK